MPDPRHHRPAPCHVLGLVAVLGAGCAGAAETDLRQVGAGPAFPRPAIDWQPRTYAAPFLSGGVVVDGRLDPEEWGAARETEPFVDILGAGAPPPRFATRARIAWDEEYLYVGARLEEPHVWGTLTERDAVIFNDNDFELFVDPDGDTHTYYELEINALGTEWDLFLGERTPKGAPAS